LTVEQSKSANLAVEYKTTRQVVEHVCLHNWRNMKIPRKTIKIFSKPKNATA
jgi:hypothetical protein